MRSRRAEPLLAELRVGQAEVGHRVDEVAHLAHRRDGGSSRHSLARHLLAVVVLSSVVAGSGHVIESTPTMSCAMFIMRCRDVYALAARGWSTHQRRRRRLHRRRRGLRRAPPTGLRRGRGLCRWRSGRMSGVVMGVVVVIVVGHHSLPPSRAGSRYLVAYRDTFRVTRTTVRERAAACPSSARSSGTRPGRPACDARLSRSLPRLRSCCGRACRPCGALEAAVRARPRLLLLQRLLLRCCCCAAAAAAAAAAQAAAAAAASKAAGLLLLLLLLLRRPLMLLLLLLLQPKTQVSAARARSLPGASCTVRR